MSLVPSIVALLLYALLAGAPTVQGQAREPYAAHVAATEPRTPEDERKGFHLPPGFEIQLVAAEPKVRKPLNINFDDRGRLWVTESIEYPFPAAPDARGRDAIRILEDTNGDGQADVVTTYTDGLNIPIGVLPVTGGALVYSIPSIYRLRGVDAAFGASVLYDRFGFNDTHGMTGEFVWGFDGWVYACHGFSNTSEVKAADGSAVRMQSGNTYRFKADGARIEQFTWGQVNPFGLAFDPLGNLYSCDCHSRPIYQLLRGAYYPSFGKPHDGLGFGPEMMSHDHGSTAIAGLAYYAADHFPPEYRDTIFIGNVVTNRINHDRLERHGSTPKAVALPDFLRSDDPWFRPVDIKLGPDGALYVADFYNRIIGHYEVPLTHPGRDRERGRIWRIVYRGPDGKGKNPALPRPDWSKATIAELIEDLAHPNLAVRFKATNQLVERGGKPGVEAVRKMWGSSSPFLRIHGLWVLERRGALADKLLTEAASDSDRGVRVHAQRVLAECPRLTEARRRLVLDGLKDPDAFVQRAAAETLGVHPAVENVRPLLDLRHAVPAADTHLMHMVRMALREQLRAAEIWARLPLADWNERDLRALADVAPGVPSTQAAAFLLEHLHRFAVAHADQARYVYHCARHGAEGSSEKLLAYAQSDRFPGLRQQLALFKALQQGTQARGARLGARARTWAEELTRQLLASSQESDVLAGLELCGTQRLEGMRGTLLERGLGRGFSEAQRGAALAALVALDPQPAIGILGQVLSDAKEPSPLRERTAGLLAGIDQPAARTELVRGLASAPGRLESAIAVGLASSRAGAETLLEVVAAGKASARLLQERPVEVRLANAKIPGLKEQIARLTRGLPPADQRLQDLLASRRSGYLRAQPDLAAGAKVFEKQCAICHQLANQGAKIGPQLDGIGLRGLDRLLEDTLDPNRNVDQAFRLTTLTLANGQIVSGLVLREEGAVLVLADAQGKEVRVAKDAIAERVVSQLSPMPANVVDQIPEADFYHLLAHLLAQQAPKK